VNFAANILELLFGKVMFKIPSVQEFQIAIHASNKNTPDLALFTRFWEFLTID